jgi:catechol 2,3-dioxygenase-like lactoylglutathione lyase family enzyme
MYTVDISRLSRVLRHSMLASALIALSGCAIIVKSDAPVTAKVDVAKEAPWNGPSFKRMTIMVSNLDRTVRLWRDIMGFQVAVNAQSGADSYSYPVFNVAPQAVIRYAMVSAGPDQQRTFAFAEVKGQPIKVQQEPRVAAAVLNANGRLAEIIELVRKEGLQVIRSHPLQSSTQGLGIEQAFVDWDGHLIVLYEFPKPANLAK